MNLSTLTVFDWVLIALLVYSTVRAFLRGFILEVVSIIGLVAGVLFAAWNCTAVANELARWITSMATARIVAFIAIALGIMILCGLMGRLLRSGADVIGLGLLDRLLGAAFGLLRGCLLGVAVMMILAAFGPKSGWTANSQLAPYFLEGAHRVSFVVPHDLEQQISDGAAELKHNAPGWIKRAE